MNYDKLHKRIDHMLNYESDDFLVNINLKQEVSDKLFDYQFLQVFNLITAFRSNNVILDGSDTGTGKTYTSIALCKQLNIRPFIICPKILISSWKEVCNYFNVRPLGISNYELIKNGKFYNPRNDDEKYIDCNFIKVEKEDNKEENFRWKLPKYGIVIFDEVHRCKNIKTQNAKLLMSTKNLPRVLLLSATLSETPSSFHIFGYMLGFYKSLKQANNWIKGMIREDKNYIGTQKQLSSINKAIYPAKGSRVRIAELGSKFPKNQICADYYNISEKHKEEVNKYFKTIMENKKIELSENEDSGEKGLILNHINTARMRIEEIKTKIIIDLVDQYLENDYNVVVFVNFKKTLKIIADHFKTDCVIYSNIDTNRRLINITKFQENKTNLIVCTLGSSSEGINLHDKYGKPRVSIISPSFKINEIIQALGRINRKGAKTPSLQRLIYCADTIEEAVCKNLRKKIDFLSKLNDNDLINING